MTQTLMEQARRFHQEGRLADAERLYRQILAQQPRDPEALHLLGAIAHQTGHFHQAAEFFLRAISLKPTDPRFHNNLGLAMLAGGKPEIAEACFKTALDFAPELVEAQNNLGLAIKRLGRVTDAVAQHRRAIQLDPKRPEYYNNLGNALKDLPDLEGAIEAYRAALRLKPDFAAAASNLGSALLAAGLVDEAIAAHRAAVQVVPADPQFQVCLGIALHAAGRPDDAIATWKQAIKLQPDNAGAYSNLGEIYWELGRIEDSLAACRKAISLRPDLSEAHNNLGNALRAAGQLQEADAAFRAAIAISPNFAIAHHNLGNNLLDLGCPEEALASYDRAIALKMAEPQGHSDRILALHYIPGIDAAAIYKELRRWNDQFAKPLQHLIRPHENIPDPNRPLRIGYVSSDLNGHVVGLSLLPLLREHDHAKFEIFCYAAVSSPDEITGQIRRNATEWRDIHNMSDAKAADVIRADGIDILVDLSGHTARNRLRLFAHKPAPIQLTYLGCVSSTGMDAIDYRFSDPHLDPPDTDLSVYSESTLRLPQTYWCYQPPRQAPDVGALPAQTKGFITFASLNNPAKLSPPALDLWAQILHAVANSRLLIHAHPGQQRQRIAARLNLSTDRLEFLPRQPSPSYFQTFTRSDISLDPFPYNGGITTCDSLYMGVPVVTLCCQTAVGRAGRSILNNVGLPELIAQTPEQFVQIARDLAADLPRLCDLRAGLRDRMIHSPLMDAKSFACDVESAYRTIWTAWCRRRTT